MRSSLICLLLLALVVSPARAQEQPEKPTPPPTDKLALTFDPGTHYNVPRRVFFRDEGKQLVTIADDGAVRLWDAASGETIKVIHPPGSPDTNSGVLSMDGKRLAIGSRYVTKGKKSYVIYVLSLPEGRLERALTVLENLPIAAMPGQLLVFFPDGKRLASGNKAGSPGAEYVRIWDLESKDAGPKLVGRGKVTPHQQGLAVSPDGARLAWVGYGKGGIIDVGADKELGKLTGVQVAWSPDGKTIATADGNELRFHEDTGKVLRQVALKAAVHQITFGPDSKKLLWVGRDASYHHLARWIDVEAAKHVLTFQPKHLAMLSFGGAISPNGQIAASVGGADAHNLFVWQTSDGKQLLRIDNPAWIFGGSASIKPAWSKDGQAVCWCSFGPKDPMRRFATFHLGDLKFVETLTADQRHDVEGARKGGKGYGGGRLTPDNRYMMRVFLEGQTITIFRAAAQEQPLLNLYRKGEDWIIWTEEGYYAATPGGERLMGWKLDNGIDKLPSLYPAERFRKQLHRPDVIKKAFELGSVAAALKELDGAKAKTAQLEELLPPKVTLNIVDQKAMPIVKVKASAQAAAKGQPITTLRLMLDGRPLSDPKMTLRFDPGKDKVEAEFTVTIPEGKHTLTAFVRSPDATSASESVTVNHVVAANLPSMHVLAIGINEHKDISLKLNCAKNDAQAIAKTFLAASKGNLFREVHTEEILDQQATRAYILTKIDDLRQRAAKSPNDLAVIFFAGHGIKKKDAFYLLTHEADLDKLEGSSLSGDDLRKALGEFPCQVLLMLDACNSAGFGQGKKLAKLGLRPATDDVSRSLTDNDIGVAVFCAAMGHEKAKEEQGNGLFTRAVMDALTKMEEVPYNRVNRLQYLHHVHSHVFDLVSAWSDEKQHPFLNLPWTTESRALRELPKK